MANLVLRHPLLLLVASLFVLLAFLGRSTRGAAASDSSATQEQLAVCAPHDPLLWRQAARPLQERLPSPPDLRHNGHVFEIGVFSGASMAYLYQQLDPPMVWGFDSFKGLPETTVLSESVRDWHAGRVRE